MATNSLSSLEFCSFLVKNKTIDNYREVIMNIYLSLGIALLVIFSAGYFLFDCLRLQKAIYNTDNVKPEDLQRAKDEIDRMTGSKHLSEANIGH